MISEIEIYEEDAGGNRSTNRKARKSEYGWANYSTSPFTHPGVHSTSVLPHKLETQYLQM